jgi:1-aminocyclopropane-1-carboxylate deaminase/D-cysteine desulfhydrase-like pyridoxal-dependent ACC family enzyme
MTPPDPTSAPRDLDQVEVGQLNTFRRVPLAYTPTPLEPMERLGKALDVHNLWIKRDDLTGLAAGGN